MALALPLLLISLLLLLLRHLPTASAVGINYGTLGNNLPPRRKVTQLLQSTLIDKVKIYDTNPNILSAFSNTGIDFIVAVENNRLANLSVDIPSTDRWLSSRILPFLLATSVVAAAVGNEYLITDLDHMNFLINQSN